MKQYKIIQLFVILLGGLVLSSCGNDQKLFEENSDDWDSYGDASWDFSGNVFAGTVSEGKTGFVMTRKEYGNFVLELEFRPDNIINSGVFIRCSDKEINTTGCYELNIWDNNPNQDFRTGAMVTKTKALNVVETIDKWNTYKIQAENDHIQVWVNDVLTTDTNDETLSEGYIGLQALGDGTIEFRNVRVRPL